jgi:hypothetical protein
VTVQGATPSAEGAVATLDFNDDSTGLTAVAHVEWRSSSADCPSASQYEFTTSEITDNSGNFLNSNAPEGFFFAIP